MNRALQTLHTPLSFISRKKIILFDKRRPIEKHLDPKAPGHGGEYDAVGPPAQHLEVAQGRERGLVGEQAGAGPILLNLDDLQRD